MKTAILHACLMTAGLLASGCVSQQGAPPASGLTQAPPPFSRGEHVIDRPLPENWWQLFNDSQLHALVEASLAANADLRAAFANLEAARAATRQADAARLPQPILESSAAIDNPAGQPSAANVSSSDYDAAATISWDIDLFGRLRAGALAARADAQAQAAALDGVRVAVAADTVLAYIDLCAARQNGAVAYKIVDAQERNLKAVREQLSAGEVSPLEVAQAASLLEASRATIPAFDAAAASARFRLATLQGLPPTTPQMAKVDCTLLPRASSEVPIGDGAALLARRPDIREAERKLASATAKITIARAELYPRITLGGALGLLSGAFSASASPLISWSFPNQAPARAKIAQAQAAERAALASFDNAVLRALREVETGLAGLQSEAIRNQALDRAREAAGLYARRTSARARIGDASPLLVIDAERTLATAALQKGQSDHLLAQSYISLFRALGGGWQRAPEPLDPVRVME